MTLTGRDRKIALALIPLLLIAGYWFMVLSPKRQEAGKLGTELVQVESERDAAEALANGAESTREDYAKDYATVVRLGKAIPTDVDMPSLLVQLDRAAKGTNIRFAKIAVGPRVAAATAIPTDGTAPAPAAGAAPAPVAAGGAAPATSSGTAVETANEGAAAAEGAPAPADGTDPAAPIATPAPALDSVPLTFSFTGSFFDLADFFHEMKRFVRLADGSVQVDGRLMKIDGFTFGSSTFPTITADVTASVYLAPKTQGTTAGGTATGPAGSVPVSDPAAATPPADGAVPAAAPAADEGVVR